MIEGGSWTVLDGQGRTVGQIDGDEFVRDGDRLIYRIDGDAIYSMDMPARLVAFVEGAMATTPQGAVFLRFVAD